MAVIAEFLKNISASCVRAGVLSPFVLQFFRRHFCVDILFKSHSSCLGGVPFTYRDEGTEPREAKGFVQGHMPGRPSGMAVLQYYFPVSDHYGLY